MEKLFQAEMFKSLKRTNAGDQIKDVTQASMFDYLRESRLKEILKIFLLFNNLKIFILTCS